MSAGSEVSPVPGYRTAKELLDERNEGGLALAPWSAQHAPAEAYILYPVMRLVEAKKNWNAFLELKNALLDDPACFDLIEGSKEMNRTGATRLATAFGLSMETVRVDEAPMEGSDRRFLVRVRVSKGMRYADGVGTCRISEIEGRVGSLSKREHFAVTRAATRAAKRAIADILGGTEAE